jgi:hypothetical protein
VEAGSQVSPGLDDWQARQAVCSSRLAGWVEPRGDLAPPDERALPVVDSAARPERA